MNTGLWFGGLHGDGVGDEVGASEVGVAGQGGTRLAIDEETDLCDAGQVGVDGAADGEHCEGFGFEAGGVSGDEAAGQIDDGKLRAGGGSGFRICAGFGIGDSRSWSGQQEDLLDWKSLIGAGCAGDGMGGVGRGVDFEQLA